MVKLEVGYLSHEFNAVSGPMLANPRRGKPKAIGSQFVIFRVKLRVYLMNIRLALLVVIKNCALTDELFIFTDNETGDEVGMYYTIHGCL